MVGKWLIDKVMGSKMKLAFVLNVTSYLLIILIPFGTTYVGYIIGVISSAFNNSGVTLSPYSLYIKSIPFNFYAIVMILISIGVILFGLGFDRELKPSIDKKKVQESEHSHDEAHEQCSFAEKAPPRPLNLILPLALLIFTTFFFLWYTGRGKEIGFMGAVMNADFEKSILISGIVSIIITSVFYVFQKIPMSEIESHFLSGGNEMMPPIIVLILSWGLSSIVKYLGFVEYITSGGYWGDNASPLGETAILSSTICDVPLMDHIKSQIPYCLTAIGISTIVFVIFAVIL